MHSVILGIVLLAFCPALGAQTSTSFGRHVLWSYGTGNMGVREGELFGPHSAEENPLNPDEIIVSEQLGNDVLLINRRTGSMRVLYGERGVPGGGKPSERSTLRPFHARRPLSGPRADHGIQG